MSYYFGIVLRDSVLFGCDRTFNNKETGENRAEEKRYSVFGDKIFLPTGNLAYCVMIGNLLHGTFASGLEAFGSGNSAFSEVAKIIYRKVKEENIGRKQAVGGGDTENVDCLYGGFDYDGTPFILTLSSVDDFQLQLINKPMQFVCLNQRPEILEYVKNILRVFMGAASDRGTDEIWELGKKFLPIIIQKVSKADPLVSANGDIVFISSKGIQTYEF